MFDRTHPHEMTPEDLPADFVPPPLAAFCNPTGPSDASSSSSSPTSATPFRVLCLHGANSNGSELSHKLNDLGHRLYQNHAIELVFINSPLLAAGPPEQREMEDVEKEQQRHDNMDNDGTIHNESRRMWWEEQIVASKETKSKESQRQHTNSNNDIPDDPSESTPPSSPPDPPCATTTQQSTTKQYVGLDASLLLLRQTWTSQPFWGLLAVGQAASVASILTLLPDLKVYPSFCIYMEGTTVLDDDEELVLEDHQVSMPHLHIVGPKPNETTQRLVRQFGGEVLGDVEPFSKVALNRVGKFLVSQKKDLIHDQSNATILALQNQLYWAEQQAAHLVAKEIAANPPKALMAVISPKEVGGFSGAKRRGPSEEGGGAPCPSDFLLQREKRTTNPDGPTRHHPGQQQQQQQAQKIESLVPHDNP